MGAFPIFEDTLLGLKETLSEMPSQLRSVMSRGFVALGSLSAEKRMLLAEEVRKNISNVSDVQVPKLASAIGIDEDSTGAIVSATSLLIALATSRPESPEVLVRELVEANLVPSATQAASLQVLQSFSTQKDELKQLMRLDSLATETLPSLRSFRTSLDLRLQFKDGQVELVVPTVVASLITDHDETNCFFQLKSSDVRQIAEQFTKLLKEIEVAEKWAQARS